LARAKDSSTSVSVLPIINFQAGTYTIVIPLLSVIWAVGIGQRPFANQHLDQTSVHCFVRLLTAIIVSFYYQR
jgi:hypothetical protein